jgi:hypothetical protein
LAEAPLQRVRDGQTISLICASDKANYFSISVLTGISENQPSGKSVRGAERPDGASIRTGSKQATPLVMDGDPQTS